MWLQRLQRASWTVVVALGTWLFVFEEWLWDTLERSMGHLAGVPWMRSFEAWIAGLPPVGAAIFFVLPTTLALPVKLIALYAIANGHLLLAALVFLAAKVLATALFAWVYVLTQPALMRVGWFVRLRDAVLRWRTWAYAQIEAHPAWRRMYSGTSRWRAWRRWVRMKVRSASDGRTF
jgi:hypothetical protein